MDVPLARAETSKLREHPTRYLRNYATAGPRVVQRILAASDPQLTLKARLRYGTATAEPTEPHLSAADITLRAAKTPAMLWPSWTLRLLPRKSPHQPRIAGIQRAAASLLPNPGDPARHREAARIMGNPQFRSNLEALLAFVDADHLAAHWCTTPAPWTPTRSRSTTPANGPCSPTKQMRCAALMDRMTLDDPGPGPVDAAEQTAEQLLLYDRRHPHLAAGSHPDAITPAPGRRPYGRQEYTAWTAAGRPGA